MSADETDDAGAEEIDDEDADQSDMVHQRLDDSSVERWVLLDGNRYLLTVLVAVAVFLIVTALGLAGYVPVDDPATATTLVGSIVGGTLPFITIVLAINQLVLSQELGWAGELDARYDDMTAFRRDVEALTETPVSPAAPADFLQLVVETVVENAESLRVASHRVDDPSLAESVDDFADGIAAEGEIVTEALEGADFGTFDALSSVLGHFNGTHLFAARTIRTEHADDLPEEAAETLDTLVELFGKLAVARQTFKTLYMQYELAHLSKLLLYVGFPTLLGGGLFLMIYGPIVDAVGDRAALVLIVALVVTLVFLPFVVLVVYTFRIATIASRTADFGPFVPRVEIEDLEQDR